MSDCCVQDTGGDGGAPPPGSSDVTVLNPPGLTLNKVPKASGASTLVDSDISDTGTNILLGVPTGISVTTGAPLNNVATALTLNHVGPGGGLAGNGVRLELDGEDTNGANSIAGTVDGAFTTATAGAEVSEIRFSAKAAGVLSLIQTIAKAGITEAAPVTTTATDAATVTTTDVMTLIHKTSGAAGIAFGVGLLFQLQNSTGVTKNAARISSTWLDPVNATEDSAIVFERTIAGAAMTTGMTIKQGVIIGSGTIDPGLGVLFVSGSVIYIGTNITTASSFFQQAANIFSLVNQVTSATAQIQIAVNTTAAANIHRIFAQAINAPTAGFIFTVYSNVNPYFAVGWGGDVSQLFADTGVTANPTSNTPTGRSQLAAVATTSVVTSNRCLLASRVRCTLETNDPTNQCVVKSVIPANGSFTLTISPISTAALTFHWEIENNL